MKGFQDKGFVKIMAFAEGLYDKQDVALSFLMNNLKLIECANLLERGIIM